MSERPKQWFNKLIQPKKIDRQVETRSMAFWDKVPVTKVVIKVEEEDDKK